MQFTHFLLSDVGIYLFAVKLDGQRWSVYVIGLRHVYIAVIKFHLNASCRIFFLIMSELS